jgi:hypothetical protein
MPSERKKNSWGENPQAKEDNRDRIIPNLC